MFTGANITLGALVPDDYAAIYCWVNDVVAARVEGAFRPVHLKDLVSQFETAGRDPSRVMLAIRQRTDHKIIGYVQIQNISAVHRSADIGIRIGEENYRGLGYGKEALGMALDYCWDHLNLERLGLIVFRDNARALNAYKAVGFKKEGLLKRLFYVDGRWVDVVVMVSFRRTRKRLHPIHQTRSNGTDNHLTAAPGIAADAARNCVRKVQLA
jgi:[ribosomal protein S5]-alanine N-acetyltransferase